MELDTEDQSHLGLKRLNMNAVANGTKNTCSKLDDFGDLGKVGRGEVEDAMVRVRLDDDGYLDLTFELVDLGGILRLSKGKFVASDPVNDETMLGKDVLGFGSFAEVVVAKMNAASVDGDTT